jgi:microcystin-dependent protein
MIEITCRDYLGNPVDKLFQWDTHVTVEITGIKLDKAPIIHFCNKNSKKALAVEPISYESGTAIVEIPQPLLEENLMLFIYIYAYEFDNKYGKTVHVCTIPIEEKLKPEDYVDAPSWYGINLVALDINVRKLLKREQEITGDVTTLYSITEDLKTEDRNINTRITTLDTAINKRLDDEVAKLNSSIELESSTRLQSDTNLQNSITAVEERVSANESSIEIINGTGEGSIAKQVADAVAGILDGAPEAYDTLNEIALWISDHPETVAAINAAIKENSDAIDNLTTLIGTLPEGEIDFVSYIQNLVSTEESRAIEVENALDSRLTSAEESLGTVDSRIADAKTQATTDAQSFADTALNSAKEYSDTTFASIFNVIYPVGCIYMSVVDTDPATLFGGTWESWGNGRVPVGVDANETEFETVEKTGGEKLHSLSTSELPVHSHMIAEHSHSLNNHTHQIPSLTGIAQESGEHTHDTSTVKYSSDAVTADSGKARFNNLGENSNSSSQAVVANSGGIHTHEVVTNASVTGQANDNTGVCPASSTTPIGGGASHNNLQPYITCYMWKRLTLAS